jgi:uncharacterized RDD family membrane protein YckC
MEPSASPLVYAGFWRRLVAMLIDLVVFAPLSFFVIWGTHHYRLFDVYMLIPNVVISILFSVVLVGKFGGTPGKLVLGMRIIRVDGTPIGMPRAFVRNLPELLLWLASAVALCVPLLNMPDDAYLQLAPHLGERRRELETLAPSWYEPLQILYYAWVYGELLVLLTNKKRRALHDFLAGSVVVHLSRPSRLTIGSSDRGVVDSVGQGGSR